VLDKSNLQLPKPSAVNSSVEGLIPVVAHFNNYTLLTRNGCLMQTIEITGEKADIESKAVSLRDAIRASIIENIHEYEFAVTIHTVRSRKNVMPASEGFGQLGKELDDSWKRSNNFQNQLINTVYVTVIYQNKSKYTNFPSAISSVFFSSRLHRKYKAELNEINTKLTAVTDAILSDLKIYGARKLTTIEEEDGVISEPLMLVDHIVHMRQKKVYLDVADAASSLSQLDIQFTFNEIKINSEEDPRVAALFSIKGHYDTSPEHLDELLHLGMEYVLTQHIVFTPGADILKKYSRIKEYAILSKNEQINDIIGINEFFNDSGLPCSFCEQQSTLTIFSDDRGFFDSKIRQSIKASRAIGVSLVREDFNMPTLFWGQIAGNLHLLAKGRFVKLDTKRAASLGYIFDSSFGDYQGSKWGAPVTVVRTDRGNLFYFNFHNRNNVANTLIVGANAKPLKQAMNFLTLQSLRLHRKLVIIDVDGSAKAFVEALGGKYIIGSELPKINPFKLKSFNLEEKDLFKKWLVDLLALDGDQTKNYSDAIDAIIKKLVDNDFSNNTLNNIKLLFEKLKDANLNDYMSSLFPSDIHACFHDGENDIANLLENESAVVALDLSQLYMNENLCRSYLSVLLEELSHAQESNGSGVMIKIMNFGFMFKGGYFKEIIGEWLLSLTDKNSMAFMHVVHMSEFEKDKGFQAMLEKIGTKLFMSRRNADKYFKRTYALEEGEIHQVKSYPEDKKYILFKQDGVSKVLNFDTLELGDSLKVLND